MVTHNTLKKLINNTNQIDKLQKYKQLKFIDWKNKVIMKITINNNKLQLNILLYWLILYTSQSDEMLNRDKS
jgi:hypothetical protein